MGFIFSEKLIEKTKAKTVPIDTAHKYGCRVCPLNRTLCMTQKMEPAGDSSPEVYILGEAPDATDDQIGKPFSSDSHDLLVNQFPHDVRLRFNNVANCKAPSGKGPSLIEIEACRKRVEEDIERTRPQIVLGYGKSALYWALKAANILNRKAPLTAWRALRFPMKIGDHSFWFIPLNSSRDIKEKRRTNQRTGESIPGEWDATYRKEIQGVIELLDNYETPVVVEEGYLDGVEWTEGKLSEKELQKVLGWIERCSTFDILGLDIETDKEDRTGDLDLDIRPYSGDGLILTIAIGNDTETYSFPIDYDGAWTSDQRSRLKEALFHMFLNFKGPKIGHNTAFDLEWLSFYLGVELLSVPNWKDTQALACSLLNRSGTMSLDVQILLYFGFHLKALSNLDKGKMKEYPLSDTLPYNGMDTKWTVHLYRKLMARLETKPSLQKVANHMQKTMVTLLKAQNRGLLVSKKERNNFNTDLQKSISEYEHKIQEIPEVKQFQKMFRTAFNPGSPQDVTKILTSVYGLEEELKDKKGKIRSDEKILKKLDLDLTDAVLALRSVTKKHSTYVKPLYKFIQSSGRIHHQYNQYVASTGRLSSSGAMNVQNWPNTKGRELRRQIEVELDYAMVPADYGQIEARIIAVASQDKTYLKALWEDYDVHYEWAERIAYAYPAVIGGRRFLKDQNALKKFRKSVKNQWTFPAFYGSSPYSIAKALGVPKEIVFQLFEDFWSMFDGVKAWQGYIKDFYDKHGYVESLTGRRRYGPMSFNEMINDPIQGTASDITVDSMTRLEEAGIVTMMNIHDDITSKVAIEDLEEAIPYIAEVMCSVPYPWINCPIAIEIACGPNWCDVEEIGTFTSAEFMDIDPTIQPLGHYREFLYS